MAQIKRSPKTTTLKAAFAARGALLTSGDLTEEDAEREEMRDRASRKAAAVAEPVEAPAAAPVAEPAAAPVAELDDEDDEDDLSDIDAPEVTSPVSRAERALQMRADGPLKGSRVKVSTTTEHVLRSANWMLRLSNRVVRLSEGWEGEVAGELVTEAHQLQVLAASVRRLAEELVRTNWKPARGQVRTGSSSRRAVVFAQGDKVSLKKPDEDTTMLYGDRLQTLTVSKIMPSGKCLLVFGDDGSVFGAIRPRHLTRRA